MTFIARPISPFSVDLLSIGTPSSYNTNHEKIPITGTPMNTSVSINNGQITLSSNKNYRLEASFGFGSTAGDVAWEYDVTVQLYNVTDSTYVGNSCLLCPPNNHYQSYTYNKNGRSVASVLVAKSELTSSITYELKVKDINGQITGIVNNSFTPSLRVFELPS